MAQGSVFEAQAGATAATTGRAAQSTTGRLQAVMVREADWQQTKRAAVFAGLDFLRGLGGTLFRNDALWNRHGSDILIPFYVPPLGAARASEEERHALKVATELALVWRGRNRGRRLTSGTPPSELLDLMQGVYTLECLGMADGSRDLRQQLEERCAAYGVEDFLRFDPAVGEPGGAVREVCLCGARPQAGARECPACRRPAVPMSRFDVWLEALVWTFHGCRMRIGLGACFFTVLQQLGQAFCELYPLRERLSQKDSHYLCYALTHVIYALNNFGERSLPASLFPAPVVGFLCEQLQRAMAADDPDLAGELLDCLKCLGVTHQVTRHAERFLVARQSQGDAGPNPNPNPNPQPYPQPQT